jgi:hypothetical protein
MKTILLLAGIMAVATGCYTKKEVVYERPAPTTTTVIRERSGTTHVYEPEVRYYYRGDTMQQPKGGEYHMR